MKFRMIPFLSLTAAAFIMLPASGASGPYSSKFQNAPAPEESEVQPHPTKQAHGKRKVYMAKEHAFMKNLSEDERTRVKSIHQKLKGNPEVAAARDAVRNAEGPEAKRAAFKKLREVRRAAMNDEDRAFMDQLREKAKANKSNKSHKKCAE